MALEVNFYAGTRELYDAEVEKDPGGLYALTDGLGIYRGLQPVAGPCPIDVNCTIANTKSFDNYHKSTGTSDALDTFVDLVNFFKNNAGHGGRPLRVTGLDGQTLLMYNCGEVNDNELSFVQATIAAEIPEGNLIEHVSATLHKLVLMENGTFTYTKIYDNLPLTDISVRKLHSKLSKAEYNIGKLQEETSDLYDQVDGLDAELDAMRQNIESRINTIENNINKISDDVADHNIKISKNTKDISRNAKEIKNHTSSIESVVNELANLTSRIDAIGESADGTNTQLSNLKVEVSDLTTRVEMLENSSTNVAWVVVP